MRLLVKRLKPSRGFSYAFYLAFNILLPVLVYVFVRGNFVPVAFALVLLSKWRMFAVRPRFWIANIRANAVDLIIGLSVVALMAGTTTVWTQLVYVIGWGLWLIFIKPRTELLGISLQALIGEVIGLTAIFSAWDHEPLLLLVAAVGLVCFFSAHHFFYGFEESHMRLLAYVWGYFGAALTWILGHWLIYYYQIIAQPTLILAALSFGIATLYYLDHMDRLSKPMRRQIVFILITVMLVILVFSDWGDKIV